MKGERRSLHLVGQQERGRGRQNPPGPPKPVEIERKKSGLLTKVCEILFPSL